DGLASSAYGPEAALTILLPVGALGLSYIGPIITVICVLLLILYCSYRQTIAAYPGGGGSYTVAKENLGEQAGLVAAAALLLDYVLNVAVGISAGIGALVSAVPSLHSHILSLCLVALAIIAIVNLRGARESSSMFSIPTYLFILSLTMVLFLGLVHSIRAGGHPVPKVAPPPLPPAVSSISWWLLMRSFASGCTAMTGVEAVSNGVSAFAKPTVQNAQRTLTAIVAVLAVLLAGIAYLSHAYGIGAMDQNKSGYESVISQLVGAVVGRGFCYYVTLSSVLAVLSLSANTSFADFPRLCRLIAEDDFLPHSFANLGRRLVYSMGIVILAVLSGLLLIIFGGITDRLIPLFAIGAFLSFTLSQAGMVMHWKRVGGRHAGLSLGINALGVIATSIALAVIICAKFIEGAWITILIIPALVLLFRAVKRHYKHVEAETQCPRPIDLTHLDQPVVIIPIDGWNTVAEKGLRFALTFAFHIIAVYVSADEDNIDLMRRQWAEYVEQPIRQANLPQPRLTILSSPYRLLFNPLLDYIEQIKAEQPEARITILIPELVQSNWYEYFLHNHSALSLKAVLLFRGDRRVVVINVPWYLSEAPSEPEHMHSSSHAPGI
ncbi:MAG: APC family permease, partial [Abitibacteriaceae bacterium]|nr:APC family permease [Abditibacteriaceae bacterium]